MKAADFVLYGLYAGSALWLALQKREGSFEQLSRGSPACSTPKKTASAYIQSGGGGGGGCLGSAALGKICSVANKREYQQESRNTFYRQAQLFGLFRELF